MATSAVASQDTPVRSDQEILVELEHAWNEAIYSGDLAFIETILADDFVAIYDNGRMGTKETELALVENLDQQVESAVQDEFIVRVYGDTAVVRFRLNLVGVQQGERAEISLRFTDVFVLQNDGWKCVSSQSTRITG